MLRLFFNSLLTLPLRNPRRFFGFFATGVSWATGLPGLVTMMGSPVAATYSMAWRHLVLNSAALIVRAIETT